jgi:hypothetical protein
VKCVVKYISDACNIFLRYVSFLEYSNMATTAFYVMSRPTEELELEMWDYEYG